jgi:hypothetical protein
LKTDGVVITHYTFDRAGFAALARTLEQYQNLYIKACSPPGPQRIIKDMAQLFVAIGCALHDCSGGIRWGARSRIPLDTNEAKGFYKDLHISLAALRNGYDVLIGGIPDLLQMLVWETDVDAPDGTAVMWNLLGIADEAVVSDLVLLHPRIREGRIICNASCKMWPDSVTRVSAIYMYCWKLRSFSETRFGGLGKCLRPLSVALLLGTDHYVKAMLAAGCKRYFLGGFERLSLLHREYAVVQCIAAMPVEALIHGILAGDRLARRPQHYSNLLKNELAALQNVPLVVFENFISIREGSAVIARELASRCWRSVQTSAADVDRHMFWELRQMPWPLASGDIEDNLIKLRDGGEQQHPVASKLRYLMRIQYPVTELIDAVRLLGLIRWSTSPSEQYHASAALMRRAHPSYQLESLVLRAFCHQLWPLCKKKSQAEC